jgi:hypothetical protein
MLSILFRRLIPIERKLVCGFISTPVFIAWITAFIRNASFVFPSEGIISTRQTRHKASTLNFTVGLGSINGSPVVSLSWIRCSWLGTNVSDIR